MDEKDRSCRPSSGIAQDEHSSMAMLGLLQRNSSTSHNPGVTFTFRDASIRAPGKRLRPANTLFSHIIRTFGPDQYHFVNSMLSNSLFTKKGQMASRTIVSGLSGIVRPGEMLLVLGRPGSGCSTFLRTAANSTSSQTQGEILYNNLSPVDFDRSHKQDAVFMPEQDHHMESLTVRQTFEFAIRAGQQIERHPTLAEHEVVEAMATLLDLGDALDTPVGGAFTPGLSGGERKRVSIAEIFATGASLQCFDNSTRGLDSHTALKFVKALRKVTNLGRKTTMAALYQAGDEVFEHFDKVLLLDEGNEIFFGPTDSAARYFEDMGFIRDPTLTTCEYLINIADAKYQIASVGSKAAEMRSSKDLALAFKNSPEYVVLLDELSAEVARGTVTSHKGKSTYKLSFIEQIAECLKREYLLALHHRRIYYTKWINTIAISLLGGSMYFDLTDTARGVFTRGGILYFALTVNGVLQFPELFAAHSNRSVLERQSRLHMFRPSAVALTRFLIDIPLIAFQHVLCVLPYYFLSRLQLDAGRFFFFYLTLFLSTVNFGNLLRMFAYYLETLDDCFRYGGFSCTVLSLFAGFLIPAQDMAPALGWLHYINPMYYAYENLITNELHGLVINCEGGNLLPTGANTNPAYQACSIPGSKPGQNFVRGEDYALSQGFDYRHRWRNIGIMIAIAFAYLVVGLVGSEIMSFSTRKSGYLSFIPNGTRFKRSWSGRNVDPEAPSNVDSSLPLQDKLSNGKRLNHIFSWNDVTVDISSKRVVNGVTGYAQRGALTALCGPSGAGKTTLLSALSRTSEVATVQGEIHFQPQDFGSAFQHVTAFAQQMDVHDETSTVREALEFAALLRQPHNLSDKEKLEYVEVVLDALDLRPYEHVLIGDDHSGLGLEQKKRVTVMFPQCMISALGVGLISKIGVELAARPELLFVDEPTSGLDSQGALHIMQYLKTLALSGQAIIVTVHQPSASMFSLFDDLLLLSSGGEQVYFGRADEVVAYFERQGIEFPAGINPADVMMQKISASDTASKDQHVTSWSSAWYKSSAYQELQSEITSTMGSLDGTLTPGHITGQLHFNTSFLRQTHMVSARIARNQWRRPQYVYSKIWVHLLSGILVGFTFYKIGTSPADLQNRMLSVYFMIFLSSAVVNVILSRYSAQIRLWNTRERFSRSYSWIALVTASILVELPAALVSTVVYFVPWYFPSGLPLSEAGYIFLNFLTYEVYQVLLGLFIMGISPSLAFAGNVLVFVVSVSNRFNGILVPWNEIQVFWRYWLYYLSPYTYLLGGMVTAVIDGVNITCRSRDLVTFEPPENMTCSAYAGTWATSARAQLLNPGARSSCTVCPLTEGDQYLRSFYLGTQGMLGNKWMYWAIFFAFTVSNFGLVYLCTWVGKVRGKRA